MYRRYYSYNDMPVVQKPQPPREKKQEEKKELCAVKEIRKPGIFEGGKVLGRFEIDDLILIAVVLALLLDDCDDLLLLAALAFIFLNI